VKFGARCLRSIAYSVLALVHCAAPVQAAAPAAPVAVDPAVLRFVADLPLYAPAQQANGTIRLWGHGSPRHDFMGQLVQAWMRGFNRTQPDVQLDDELYGTASAIGALYTGAADIAILGEEINPAAARAFERERGYSPTRILIATGSLDVNYFDYAHMIFVHKDNPLTHLTMAQLDAIFGAEHRRGPRNVRSWGELGLGGEWEEARIQPYAWRVDEDFALFFRATVLEGSHRWNPQIEEFVTVAAPDAAALDRGQQIIDALARDRYGIAISNLRFANDQVKALALGWNEGGPYYEATPATLIDQSYPLTRYIPAFIDRAPGQPIAPKVQEFLRYILSRDGQRALLEHSGYLPLSADALRAQREQLDCK
jgi:phosphate transport system substrate-binding protein